MGETRDPVDSAVDFLRTHPPFDAAGAAELTRLATVAEVERHAPGAVILEQGTGPVEHVRVVRSGGVEIVHDGRVLDLLGPGELFGHAAMLAGLPTGFSAVARGATDCYRLPADEVRSLLARPAGLRYLARSLLAPTLLAPAPTAPSPAGPAEPPLNPAQRPVGELLRGPVVMCLPDLPIREAAQQMTACGATCAVVRLDDSRLGILTDRDLRQRVIAGGMDTGAAVSAAMTAPAYTVAPDRLGGEVLLDMLDRGIRHLPVLSPTGAVLGVLEDLDLVAVTTRSSFHLRAAIARADSVPAVVEASAALVPAVIGLHRARVAATDIAAIHSVVVDAITRRLVELAVADLGPPPRPFTWLALGSLARREAVPSSDVDSALVWVGPGRDADAAAHARAIADRVLAGLAACGLHVDTHGAVASNPLFARSYEAWTEAARGWFADPTTEKAPILVSLIVDARPVWGVRSAPPMPDVFHSAHRHPELLRLLGRYALAHRPPTGFLRDFVVEHSGRRRGRLDLKAGGLVPIVDLARWAGMAAGVTSASTPTRLRAAAAAGTVDPDSASTLEEAFHVVLQLRMTHQVAQMENGEPPDDHVRPRDLSPLARSSLREAFREVAAVQRRIASSLDQGVR